MNNYGEKKEIRIIMESKESDKIDSEEGEWMRGLLCGSWEKRTIKMKKGYILISKREKQTNIQKCQREWYSH